jgi:hypothetical protein
MAIVPVMDANESALRAAITAANPGDEVLIANGGTIALTAPLAVSKTLTITGNGETWLDGGFGTGIFTVSGGSAVMLTLKNLALYRGNGTLQGGALNVGAGAGVTLDHVTLQDNIAQSKGAAVYMPTGG